MYRFDSGAIGVLEDNWCLRTRRHFKSMSGWDRRDGGSITFRDSSELLDLRQDGVAFAGHHLLAPVAWRVRAARWEELAYFITCVSQGRPPTVITPEESGSCARACAWKIGCHRPGVPPE
jgi:hypothetical protein